MDDSVLAIYCLCDDLLKALKHSEDSQRQMSDAEVRTTAIVAALYFGGNFERARSLLTNARYIPGMLSKSQFNRRLHSVRDLLQERCEIELSPMRKKNSRRPSSASLAYLQAVGRKQVETAGSMIERLLPKSIHAVTANGFTLKVFLFVLAYSFSRAL